MSNASSPSYALVGRRSSADEEAGFDTPPELRRARRWLQGAGAVTGAGILVVLVLAVARIASPAATQSGSSGASMLVGCLAHG